VEVSCGAPGIHLHLANRINCVFVRTTKEDYLIQVYRLRQILERDQPLVLNFDI
jgi:hypothetical protein